MLIVGAFDEAGSPTIPVRISGELGSREYIVTIDTGFTGFVALPTMEIVPLGLSTLPSAASVMLGNGEIIYNLIAQGRVTVGGQSVEGPILLDDTGNDTLVGMAFLRAFQLALIVTDSSVVLHDRDETLEAVTQFVRHNKT